MISLVIALLIFNVMFSIWAIPYLKTKSIHNEGHNDHGEETRETTYNYTITQIKNGFRGSFNYASDFSNQGLLDGPKAYINNIYPNLAAIIKDDWLVPPSGTLMHFFYIPIEAMLFYFQNFK